MQRVAGVSYLLLVYPLILPLFAALYMLFARIAFAALLGSVPLLGRAQSPADGAATPAPAHRFYVGVAAYSSEFEHFGRRDGQPFTAPVQVTLGYQLQPRLALQVGFVSSAYSRSLDSNAIQADGTLGPHRVKSRNRSRSFSALGRYTLSAPSLSRLQVDALGGVTVHQQTYDFSVTGSPSYGDYERHSRTTDIQITGGVSARYRLSSHLQAVADGTLNVGLGAGREAAPAGALGVRYTFGRW